MDEGERKQPERNEAGWGCSLCRRQIIADGQDGPISQNQLEAESLHLFQSMQIRSE